MVAPGQLWGSSDASSSIYSNDDDEVPLFTKPAITRKDSATSTVNSTISRNPTIYSEESIKSMGYRPFEYWKGPKPAAAPSRKRPPPPLPPPRFTGTNPMKPINSLQDFKPLPKAKVLEMQSYIKEVAPPPSPRVKDRYAARMAERARRKRERMQRMQRIEEWPGWVPDEKVLLGQQQNQQQNQQQQQQRRQVRIDVAAQAEAASLASRERWLSPRTWRRRVWGIVTTLGVLVLIGVIIVSTTITQDNAPGVKTPLSVRLDPSSAAALEVGEAPFAASPLPSGAISLSSSPPVSPAARRIARRFRRRHR